MLPLIGRFSSCFHQFRSQANKPSVNTHVSRHPHKQNVGEERGGDRERGRQRLGLRDISVYICIAVDPTLLSQTSQDQEDRELPLRAYAHSNSYALVIKRKCRLCVTLETPKADVTLIRTAQSRRLAEILADLAKHMP